MEARPGRLAMASDWWHRWPIWSPSAALAWSASYGMLGPAWALGGPGFPFGERDPEGAAMGSVLFAVRAEPTGWVIAGCCLPVAIVAVAMRRPTTHRCRHRVLLAAAWCFAITLLLVIPDIRLLQNLAYGLMFVFCRTASPGWPGPSAFRSASTRIVTLGLVRPWVEVWPRWIPFLAGRRIPVVVPTTLGGLAALAITVGGFSFIRLGLIEAMGLAPEPAEPPTFTGWATWAPGWLWPLWGITLAIATSAYHHRRHDRHLVAAGARLRQGTPR
jgi:hypothetical protein